MKYPKERRERENNIFFFKFFINIIKKIKNQKKKRERKNIFFFFIFVFIYQYIINKIFINNENTKHMKILNKRINNILSIQKISFFVSSVQKSMHCRSLRVY